MTFTNLYFCFLVENTMDKFYTVPLGRHSHVDVLGYIFYNNGIGCYLCICPTKKQKNKKQKDGIKYVSGGQGIYMKMMFGALKNVTGRLAKMFES